MDLTSLLIFLLLGLVAGWLASVVMKGGYGIIGDMVVGVVGAFIGGWLSSLLFGVGVTGFNPLSILIAFVGACILIAILRAVSGRRVTV
ncbi:MAG: GlsB/YeaQ/YmgE family stress response membrane protein [Chloroflexota bacterium]